MPLRQTAGRFCLLLGSIFSAIACLYFVNYTMLGSVTALATALFSTTLAAMGYGSGYILGW